MPDYKKQILILLSLGLLFPVFLVEAQETAAPAIPSQSTPSIETMASPLASQQSPLLTIPSNATLEFQEVLRIPLLNCKRFLAMDPGVVMVSKEENAITIRGINIGETTVIIWVDQRYTINIKVIPPPIKISNQQQILERNPKSLPILHP